jgi:dolichol-phosphate mannosyltransferase
LRSLALFVVTPTYQEADNISEFLERRARPFPMPTSPSSTTTALMAPRTRPRDGTQPRQHRVLLTTEEGRYRRCGLRRILRSGSGGYDVIVQIDADLSHDPGALPT